jgi:hypothetical protein
MGFWGGTLACRSKIAASNLLQNSPEFGSAPCEWQNSSSDNSARHNFSKILGNSGNSVSANQNPYSVISATNAITIWFGTPCRLLELAYG